MTARSRAGAPLLSDNRLTGSIPTQLGGLTALTAHDLSGNLPAGLRDMPPTLPSPTHPRRGGFAPRA